MRNIGVSQGGGGVSDHTCTQNRRERGGVR